MTQTQRQTQTQMLPQEQGGDHYVDILSLENVEVLLQMEEKPEVSLNVNGRDLSFLCDSGATRTVICLRDASHILPNQYLIAVKAANGAKYTERLSETVVVRDPETDMTAQSEVVLSNVCPYNLLGRDMMKTLKIAVVPTQKGMRAQRGVPEIFLKEGEPPLNYWYSLDLVSTGPSAVTTRCLKKSER